MPIEFRCTGCEILLRTGDHTGGMPAKCPECGALQTIPEYDSQLNIAPRRSDARREPGCSANNFGGFSSDEGSAAVVSLLLGVTALMTSCCLPLSFPVALIGLVMGIRALGSKYRVLAVIGTILSFLGLIATFVATCALLFRF